MISRKIKSIIVEDEYYDRRLIVKILEDEYSEYIEVLDAVGSTEAAIESIHRNKPELLFLDIELNGDRNAAFHILEQIKDAMKVIFVTAKSTQDDLLRAIKLSCIDYLIKPTKISDFEIPIRKVYAELNQFPEHSKNNLAVFKHNAGIANLQDGKISLQDGFSYMPVLIKNIIRCEAEGNYTRFYFLDRTKLLANGNLKFFEDRLTGVGFCRISKSELINLAHIKSFSRKNVTWEITMIDNKIQCISVQRKQKFLMMYNEFHLN